MNELMNELINHVFIRNHEGKGNFIRPGILFTPPPTTIYTYCSGGGVVVKRGSCDSIEVRCDIHLFHCAETFRARIRLSVCVFCTLAFVCFAL